jgi:trans-aconitate methyltransferase
VRVAAAVALMSALTLGARGPIIARGGDVPYVQTPDRVVHEMLTLAGVGPDDVVYDLGAGDGRIVIAAARWYGARGVGIEIDPALVEQARRDAARTGVADRARFEAADLFTTDLHEATVVTLYLSPELNARLRPQLLSQLRPGARIVSHQFPIADWAPDRTIRLSVDGREHVVHLWLMRAPAP